jgi:hypothetical protein
MECKILELSIALCSILVVIYLKQNITNVPIDPGLGILLRGDIGPRSDENSDY